jgi:hypothetical protein
MPGNAIVFIETCLAESSPPATADKMLSPDSILDALKLYITCNLYEDVLLTIKKQFAKYDQTPVMAYFHSYVLYKLNKAEDSRRLFEQAEGVPENGVNPFSSEIYKILKALDALYDGVKIKYYIGLLLASFDSWQDAKFYWEKALAEGFKSPLVYRCLGLYYWKQEKDLNMAAHYYSAGYNPEAVSYKYIYEMSLVLKELNCVDGRIRMFEQMPESLKKNSFVDLACIQLLFDQKKYEKVIERLGKSRFSLYEGKRVTIDLFINANIKLGEMAFRRRNVAKALKYFQAALSYPWNLGVGRSVGCVDMKTKYWICRTLIANKEKDKALKLMNRYLEESETYSFNFKTLKTIRWEEDMAEPAKLVKENRYYQKKMRILLCQHSGIAPDIVMEK